MVFGLVVGCEMGLRGVVVVMPTYNEAENVRRLIPEVLGRVGGAGWRCMVLVVDDSSPDGTAEVAERIGGETGSVRVLRRPGKMGLGSAYVDGFTLALREYPWAEYICEMDADGSHPPEVLVEMLEEAERSGADVVVASRYIGSGRWENAPLHRILISRGANLLARLSTGLRVIDATSGFRVIRAEALRRVVDRLSELRSGYVFQVQLLYLLYREGFRIAEHPFRFKPRWTGSSKLGKKEIFSFAGWCLRTLFRRLMG